MKTITRRKFLNRSMTAGLALGMPRIVLGAEYLAYAPSGGPFTMDLSAMPSSRKLAVEWFNPARGETISQDSIAAGSSSKSFSAPFAGDAVLYLVDSDGHH